MDYMETSFKTERYGKIIFLILLCFYLVCLISDPLVLLFNINFHFVGKTVGIANKEDLEKHVGTSLCYYSWSSFSIFYGNK